MASGSLLRCQAACLKLINKQGTLVASLNPEPFLARETRVGLLMSAAFALAPMHIEGRSCKFAAMSGNILPKARALSGLGSATTDGHVHSKFTKLFTLPDALAERRGVQWYLEPPAHCLHR